MRLSYLAIMICLSFVRINYRTTYHPVALETLLEGADAVVEGKVNGKSFKKLPTGEVVTEYSLQIDKSAGLGVKNLNNQNAFKIIVPGGEWQGMVYKLEGIPDMESDESKIYTIKKFEYGYTLSSLGMSVFRIETDNQYSIVKNEIFPENKLLSLIELDSFNSLVNARFGTVLAKVVPDKFVVTDKPRDNEKRGRHPSSKQNKVNLTGESNEENKIIYTVLIFVLLMIFWKVARKMFSEVK